MMVRVCELHSPCWRRSHVQVSPLGPQAGTDHTIAGGESEEGLHKLLRGWSLRGVRTWTISDERPTYWHLRGELRG
jgi:hypothetical protein